MSLKPVYIPKRKRQRTQEIFNRNDGDSDEDERPLAAPTTVTSSRRMEVHPSPGNGPTQQSIPRPEDPSAQKPEDFMDERDHNEWGGPTRVKADFEATSDVRGALRVNTTIGEQLLRKLGWRESTDNNATITAYISKKGKCQETNSQPDRPGAGDVIVSHQEQQQSILLSQKQLQKIVRKQTHVKIPEPWKGRAGLGYAALRDAPEFRAAERQRRADQDRRFDTYKVSDVLGPQYAREDTGSKGKKKDNDGYYESLEDFVGYRSTAGFALREDEDDAYDPSEGTNKSIHTLVSGGCNGAPKTASIDKRGYEATAYDHEDSDPDEKEVDKPAATVQLDALSGWAQGTSDTSRGNALPGFILGINSAPHKTIYQGPNVPKDWRITPHRFGPFEHPSILQAIARAVQIEAIQEQREIATQKALQAAKVSARRREGLFASVGASMKNRFAAEGSVPVETATPQPKGESWESITRTVHSFVPDPLLCKRLNVTPPQRDRDGSSEAPLLGRTRDQAYFQDEILKVAAESQTNQNELPTSLIEDIEQDADDEPDRPALAVYKAIFDPVGDDDDKSTDLSDTEEAKSCPAQKEEPETEPKKEPQEEMRQARTLATTDVHHAQIVSAATRHNPRVATKEEMNHRAEFTEARDVVLRPPSSIVEFNDGMSSASSSSDEEFRKRRKRKRRSKKEDSKKKRKKRKDKKKRSRKSNDHA